MNRFFHYKDRGGTIGKEITAGLGMFFLSVCGLFINMQLIAKLSISGEYAAATSQQIAVNGEYYALTWFLSMIIAFAGSLLIGLVARLPLVQVSGLGISTVLVSMIGIETGLNYYNLLFVCFISSIIYTALVAVPGVKQFIFRALPQPVRRALPAASGLLMAWIALQLTGIINLTASNITIYGAGTNGLTENENVLLSGGVALSQYSYSTDKYHPLLLIGTIAVIFTVILFLIVRQRTKRPFFISLMGGTAFYLLVSIFRVCFDWKTKKFALDSLWGRLWMVGSEDAMQTHLSAMLKSFSFTRVLTKGSDFSAYTEAGGSVVLLFAVGILTFLLLNMYESEAALQAVSKATGVFDADEQKDVQKALLCNAVINIAAPLIGTTPVSIGKESVAAGKDGAKSGLASVVASIGFLVSIFVWIVPFIFATSFSYDISFNLYGHYGTVMQLMAETGFVVADIVMVLVGVSMIAGSMYPELKKFTETAPFMTTVAGTFLLSNLAAGAALGTVCYVITALAEKKEEGDTRSLLCRIGIPQLVWCAVSVILLMLMVIR